MNDQQTSHTGALAVRTSGPDPMIKPGCIEVEIDADAHVIVETYDLLGMIDRADPDAMRAYLRETTGATVTIADLAEADLADLVDRSVRGFDGPVTDPRLPAHIAAGIAEELLEGLRDQVPEVDSPEDVDEHAVIELTDDIDTRLHVIERLAKILRAGTDAVEVCTLADWVIDR